MKKTLIRSFSLSTALVLCGSSLAEAQKMIDTYGTMQVTAYTSDSQRNNTPDFFVNKLRLGVRVNEGGLINASVQLQFQGWGPLSAQYDNMFAPSTQSPVYVREARLNIVPIQITDGENSFRTTVALGGIHIGGADQTTPDIASTLSSFDRMDGVYLYEDMKFGSMITAQVGIGYFNTLSTTIAGPTTNYGRPLYSPVVQNFMPNPNYGSFVTDKAFVATGAVSAHFDEQVITGKVLYGQQDNAPATVSNDTNAVPTYVNSVSHLELSLLWNHEEIFGTSNNLSGNGVSFFFEEDYTGALKSATAVGRVEGGNYNYTTVAASPALTPSVYLQTNVPYYFNQGQAITNTFYGLSIAGDTKNYWSDFLKKDDTFTYAAAWTLTAYSTSNPALTTVAGVPTKSGDLTINELSASVGYAYKSFEIAYNILYASANSKMFYDANGNKGINKSAMRSYITAVYSF